jgi:8-oxo-dGTP diphosphatase
MLWRILISGMLHYTYGMKESYTRVGIGVFIFKDGKFLIGRRVGAHGDGDWSIPGGHLEFGESFEETARREAKEETGLEITNLRFGAVTNDLFTKENKHYISIWMMSSWKSGTVAVTEPDRNIDFRWITFDELPDRLFLPWNQLKASEFYQNIQKACIDSAGA